MNVDVRCFRIVGRTVQVCHLMSTNLIFQSFDLRVFLSDLGTHLTHQSIHRGMDLDRGPHLQVLVGCYLLQFV